jgi:hypothetical protein
MIASSRYSMEETERRGDEIYERKVRPLVEAGNKGKIVAIDIESEDYVVADTGLAASDQLLARNPDAEIWCIRIGYPTVHRIGGSLRSTSE